MATLLVRADAGPSIGAGHVMRCLALAQAWQQRGGEVVFATASEMPGLAARISAMDMVTRMLPLEVSSQEVGGRKDAEETVELARQIDALWVVVDGYDFDAAYQAHLRDAGLRVLWIDDEAHAEHYVADRVLNQNLHAEETLYVQRDPSTRLLLGPRYALLRREFSRWQGWERRIPPKVRKVLVTLGGGDPDNVTLKVLQSLQQLELPELEVKAVVGGLNPHLPRLRAWIESSDIAVELLHDVADMSELMAWADLAISAAGSTSWELAFMGLPALLVVTAENQQSVAAELSACGAAVSLGDADKLSANKLAAEVGRLVTDRDLRQELAEWGQRLVDGLGPSRILASLFEEPLLLRPVRWADRRLIWQWANDPIVRKFAFNTERIPWESHLRWFDQRLASDDCFHYLALDSKDAPVGQVRFDVTEPGVAEIDVSIAADFRGAGYGSALLRLAAKRLFRESSITTIRALIKLQNLASARVFEKAGFETRETMVVGEYEARQCVFVKS